ncbi:MAG: hypothetical protein MZW92_09805 [Comamonadaceae bacterium]|nr:hypothetical protein [Comamonadaceae bacterium]
MQAYLNILAGGRRRRPHDRSRQPEPAGADEAGAEAADRRRGRPLSAARAKKSRSSVPQSSPSTPPVHVETVIQRRRAARR